MFNDVRVRTVDAWASFLQGIECSLNCFNKTCCVTVSIISQCNVVILFKENSLQTRTFVLEGALTKPHTLHLRRIETQSMSGNKVIRIFNQCLEIRDTEAVDHQRCNKDCRSYYWVIFRSSSLITYQQGICKADWIQMERIVSLVWFSCRSGQLH